MGTAGHAPGERRGLKAHMHVCTVAVFTIAKARQHPQARQHRRVKKRWHMCTTEHYSAVKRNEIMPFAAKWMDLETVIGEGDGTPLQYSCLENPMDGDAWEAAVHGVTKSRT